MANNNSEKRRVVYDFEFDIRGIPRAVFKVLASIKEEDGSTSQVYVEIFNSDSLEFTIGNYNTARVRFCRAVATRRKYTKEIDMIYTSDLSSAVGTIYNSQLKPLFAKNDKKTIEAIPQPVLVGEYPQWQLERLGRDINTLESRRAIDLSDPFFFCGNKTSVAVQPLKAFLKQKSINNFEFSRLLNDDEFFAAAVDYVVWKDETNNLRFHTPSAAKALRGNITVAYAALTLAYARLVNL